MVDGRHEGETDFSDDLHPELKGGAGAAPRTLGKSWPGRGCVGRWFQLSCQIHASLDAGMQEQAVKNYRCKGSQSAEKVDPASSGKAWG
jgi:hypothetical protein